MKDEFPNASESFKRLNPHLFAVRPVETNLPEPAPSPALDRRRAKHQTGEGSLAVRVVFIVACKRRLDDDNLQGACKPLRDAVAASLGIDDGSKRLTFEYHQIHSTDEGVIVQVALQ